MRKERELTPEEMEQHHIYDDDWIWETVYNSVCETDLETIFKDARQIKDAFDSWVPFSKFSMLEEAIKAHDGEAVQAINGAASIFDFVPTDEGCLLALLLQFFYLGAWHGAKAYRREILSDMTMDADYDLKEPEETEYKPNDGDIDKYLCDSAGQEHFQEYAKKIHDLFPILDYICEDAAEGNSNV